MDKYKLLAEDQSPKTSNSKYPKAINAGLQIQHFEKTQEQKNTKLKGKTQYLFRKSQEVEKIYKEKKEIKVFLL